MSADSSTNLLQPPVGTSYDGKETITIFNNQDITFWDDEGGGAMKTETLTWSVDLYKYVTGAKPTDPDFRQNGGTIYIVMVHRGIVSNAGFSARCKYGHRITVPSTISPVRHYPATDTGTQDGNNWDYSISFKQNMSMFQNGGNSPFTFDAEYQETFTRSLAKQDGSITSTGAEFSLQFVQAPGLHVTWPMEGLTIFQTQDPSIFPVQFNFETYVYEGLDRVPGYERYIGNATASAIVDFKFTA